MWLICDSLYHALRNSVVVVCINTTNRNGLICGNDDCFENSSIEVTVVSMVLLNFYSKCWCIFSKSMVCLLNFFKLYDGCITFAMVRFYYRWSKISELLDSITHQEIKYKFIRLYIWRNTYIWPYIYTLPYWLYVRPITYIQPYVYRLPHISYISDFTCTYNLTRTYGLPILWP